jgi:hypothetical protein
MNENIDGLLTELEELSAKALEQVDQSELTTAVQLVEQRGAAIGRLQTAIASSGPLSYVEWNRMTVIHCQGNRLQSALEGLRGRLAAELVLSAREHALLDCVTGVVGQMAAGVLDERG